MSIHSHLQRIIQIPHCKRLNIALGSVEDTAVTLQLPFNTDIIGDPINKLMHGAAITTLIDTACGVAILQAQNNLRAMATIDLRVDHMRAAESGKDIFARADCHHLTHTIAFVRAVAYTTDINEPIATATGTFMRSNESFPET